jgi:hypothetical protein
MWYGAGTDASPFRRVHRGGTASYARRPICASPSMRQSRLRWFIGALNKTWEIQSLHSSHRVARQASTDFCNGARAGSSALTGASGFLVANGRDKLGRETAAAIVHARNMLIYVKDHESQLRRLHDICVMSPCSLTDQCLETGDISRRPRANFQYAESSKPAWSEFAPPTLRTFPWMIHTKTRQHTEIQLTTSIDIVACPLA